jgi:nucleoside-diphosphate-sugar epimerase
VIPTIITQALTKDELRLGSLTPSRDFTFVSDTVAGFLCCAASDEAVGQEINLGTNNSITIGDLVEKVFAILGTTPNIITESQRLRPEKSEVLELHASNQKAKQLINWQPVVSLDEGLRRTIDWIADHLDLYQPDKYAV